MPNYLNKEKTLAINCSLKKYHDQEQTHTLMQLSLFAGQTDSSGTQSIIGSIHPLYFFMQIKILVEYLGDT